jgi:molybdopterin/thiamine biosynthesis adenylyltransferase
MALADYFNKNIQSAALLLQGIDAEAFKTVLEGGVVCIAFDDAAAKSFEGQATLDLAVRSLARLYPVLVLLPSGTAAIKLAAGLEALARSVNSKLDVPATLAGVTQCLVVGKKRPKFPTCVNPFIRYIGSDNWFAKISATSPVGCGKSKNPFGAGGAACIGVANIFRATFAAQLPTARADDEAIFSMLDFAPITGDSPNPALSKVDFAELHLIGIGAIGNGFLWAVARLRASGELHLVDAQPVELSNLQRYVMTVQGDETKLKVDLAKEWLARSGVAVHRHRTKWEDYVAERNRWHFERVAVALDTVDSRINVQASLPKQIHNSWTQAGEAGTSRHGFLGSKACLACLYMPGKQVPNYDELIARGLGLPLDDAQLLEIRRRLDLAIPTDRAFLEQVAAARNVPIERLVPFENKPLESLYIEAVCGGAVMELANPDIAKRIEVPMAFQSAFAGVLMAADVVAEVANLRSRLPTTTQINLLTSLPELPSSGQAKSENSRCICVDPDFIDAYKAKYKVTTSKCISI